MSAFGRMLRERHGEDLPLRRGDWTDWWTNGYGCDARLVGVNRSMRSVLAASEDLACWLKATGDEGWDAERAQVRLRQGDPRRRFGLGEPSPRTSRQTRCTRSPHYAYKADDVYTAALESHDLLARSARRLADQVSRRGPDGVFNLGDLDPQEAYPPADTNELLVYNTLPWERTVIVEEPELRGNTAPDGMLEMFFPRDVPWGGNRPVGPVRRVKGTVPAIRICVHLARRRPGRVRPRGVWNHDRKCSLSASVLTPQPGPWPSGTTRSSITTSRAPIRGGGSDNTSTSGSTIPEGGMRSSSSTSRGSTAGSATPIRPYVRETVQSVVVGEPTIRHGRASISVEVTGKGLGKGTCTFALDPRRRCLEVDWVFDKEETLEPESVYVAFPFNLGEPTFSLDMGVPVIPDAEQIDGSVRDWYPVQKWAAVSDGDRTVIVTPLDAPLMQLGGITIQRWAKTLEPDGPNLMAWPMNNHWDVNFKASQGGRIEERYLADDPRRRRRRRRGTAVGIGAFRGTDRPARPRADWCADRRLPVGRTARRARKRQAGRRRERDRPTRREPPTRGSGGSSPIPRRCPCTGLPDHADRDRRSRTLGRR